MLIAPVESTPVAVSDGIRGLSPSKEESFVAPSTGVDSFGSVLNGALAEANKADFTASQKVQALASGAIDDLHGTMIAVKEADIALKLVGSVRTKLLDAFQELWRTSV